MVAAADPLATGPGQLAFRSLAAWRAGILLQLVGAVEIGFVGRGVHARADTEAVDRCARSEQVANAVFVEVAARQNPHLRLPSSIEDCAHAPCVFAEIAAVDADRIDLPPVGRQLREQCEELASRLLGVIGVDQQGRAGGLRAGKILERLAFAGMRLDVRVGHRTEERNSPELPGEDRRGAGETGEMAGARREEAGLGAMRSAQAEIDERAAGGGENTADRLGCDHRLELQQVDDPRFDELRLANRRHDAQQGLVGKAERAFGQCIDVAAEVPVGERRDEIRAKTPAVAQPVQFVGRETGVLEMVEHLLEAGGDEEVALFRQLADEELEHRRLVHAAREIGLQHGELVEIGQQQAFRIHSGNSSKAAILAPSSDIWASARTPSSACTLTARTASSSTTTARPSPMASRTVLRTQYSVASPPTKRRVQPARRRRCARSVPANAEYASRSRSVAFETMSTAGGSPRSRANSAPAVPATQCGGHGPPCARNEQ